MSEMCETCIFRPGNKLQLKPGALKQLIDGAVKDESCIPCHKTTYGQDKRGEAICRGFYDRFATVPIRLAAAMDLIEFQEYGSDGSDVQGLRRMVTDTASARR